MEKFDQLAASWDTPEKIERAMVAAEKLITAFPEIKGSTALEFGAGTGLLSRALCKHLKHITVVDSSQKMVDEIHKKFGQLKYVNYTAIRSDVSDLKNSGKYFELIYSLLALHHITDIENAFKSVSSMQKSGNMLVIFDLYPEDGSFHNFEDGIHLGFSEQDMEKYLSQAGYKQMSFSEAFRVHKLNLSGTISEYPVFMSVARKE